jgi:lipoyl-dependent peroxiredoxin
MFGSGSTPNKHTKQVNTDACGFGIQVGLRISVPGLPREQVEALVQKANIVCPYSNATRGNIDVKLVVA